MKIAAYEVTATAQRSYLQVKSTTALLTTAPAGSSEAASGVQPQEGDEAATVSLSEGAQQAAEQAAAQKKLPEGYQLYQPKALKTTKSGLASGPEDLKLQLLDAMLFALTGKRHKMRQMQPMEEQPPHRAHWPAGAIAARPGGELRALSVEQFHYESEQVSYQATGLIKTADGQEISLDLSLSMSRQFVSYSKLNIEFERPLMDPLVINYGGTAASLTGQKFAFDLDFDGQLDQISFAGEGSGFLALDQNGDGVINNGSELFGPSSGSGFGELRAYDQDGNGWIDENDRVFSQLRVWSKDAEGNDQLFTLAELGVGAIYLGDVATEFALTDEANSGQGVIRSTSFFLKENGGAGTVQHVDLLL